MPFPLSWKGEFIITPALGAHLSADSALGRLDAALSAEGPDDITRTRSRLTFAFSLFHPVRQWRRGTVRRYWGPNTALYKGSVSIAEEEERLRVTYSLDFTAPMLANTLFLIAFMFFPLTTGAPKVAAVIFFTIILSISLLFIADAIRNFPSFVRDAVLSGEASGPEQEYA
jgi:hypothetical protein